MKSFEVASAMDKIYVQKNGIVRVYRATNCRELDLAVEFMPLVDCQGSCDGSRPGWKSPGLPCPQGAPLHFTHQNKMDKVLGKGTQRWTAGIQWPAMTRNL